MSKKLITLLPFLLTPFLVWAEPSTEEKVELLTDEVTRLRELVEDDLSTGHGSSGMTTVGGYGELHYNHLKDMTSRSKTNEIDFHRFVLFIGHEFSESIRLFSELELEHALVKDTGDSNDGSGSTKGSGPGEIELEQAYIQFDLHDQVSANAGVFLLPLGILNETHEPPTFYGVERNPVEKNIIPATWWEAGAALMAHTASGFSADLAYHSGLFVPTSGSKAYKIRDGRQKVAKATSNNGAVTARLKWVGIKGLEVAVSGQQQQDITQGTDPTAGEANLVSAHLIYTLGPVTVKALHASWDLDGSGPKAVGRDKQVGYYVEPSVKIGEKVGLFVRTNTWDNEAGNSADTEIQQTDVGINYWPHEDVVIKADYQKQDAPKGKAEMEGVNLGIGYMF